MENNGETYVDFKQVKVIIDTSKLHVKLENLFNGDKALGKLNRINTANQHYQNRILINHSRRP